VLPSRWTGGVLAEVVVVLMEQARMRPLCGVACHRVLRAAGSGRR
jgi:hypothetical protein